MRRARPEGKGGVGLAAGLCGLVSWIAASGAEVRPVRAQPLPLIWAQTSRPAPASLPTVKDSPAPAPAPQAAAAPKAAPAPSALPTAAAKPDSGATPRPAPDLSLASLLRTQPLAAATAGLGLALLIADRLVLWKRPRWLLRLPDQGVQIPLPWDPSKKLSLGPGLIGFLKARPRVLDAWVEQHQARIQKRFSALATVEQRRHHLGLPVLVGQTLEPELTPERLRQLEGAVGGLLLISGEGGVGKTSLALRIAGWALEGRLTDHPVVPLLVEADLQGEESLLSRLRSSLLALSESLADDRGSPPVTLPMVRALLERRRLLVIIDHFSELGDRSRRLLNPAADAFPSAWTIVTSRQEEHFGGKRVLHLRPQRLTADRLWPFFTDYLRLEQAEEALDFDLHQRAVIRFREITAGLEDEQQAITVLLAKLYIDVVLSERRGAGGSLLPASVPALMLTYVRQINGTIPKEERQPPELVVRALQHLAQASETKLFRPRAVRRDQALSALALACAEWQGREAEEESRRPSAGVELLRYLVERLMLVEAIGDGGALRLVLDPLADYLAALGWLRQLDRDGDGAWDPFLAQTLPAPGTEAASLAQGFLRALYDSAEHAADQAVLGLEVPKAVKAQLAERAAIDPLRIAREREERRLRRLIDDLAEPDPEVRLKAIDELCRRRSRAGTVIEALGRVLRSDRQDLEVREAAAIALAVQGGAAAAWALAEVLASPLPDGEVLPGAVALRRTVLEGLGLVVAGLRQASQAAEREELLQLLERQLRADGLDLLVEGEAGWMEHDRRLPLLQGASRGLQLAVSADLPLLGSGPGRAVPMLTLTALEEGAGLRIRTEVVSPKVWKLPLPGGEQLELVLVPGDDYTIGSPEGEAGRDDYTQFRQKREGVNVEAQRRVSLKAYALVRHPISQAQWRAVAALPRQERDISPTPGTYKPDGLWESHAQPGGLAVDSVSWNDCQEWLQRLNRWLKEQWPELGGQGAAPQLALPSESQWEAACRAGAGTPFHFGDTLDASWANYDGGYTYGRGRKGAYRQRPVPMGSFGLVNRWGLAELHGQLLEWCEDQWHRDPLEGAVGDGRALDGPDPELEGTIEQSCRLLRGGSGLDVPIDARAALRFSYLPDFLYPSVGVRPGCFSPPGSLLGS